MSTSLLILIVLIAAIYFVIEATRFRSKTNLLDLELKNFKDSGLNTLVEQQLKIFREKTEDELVSREKLIRETQLKLATDGEKATKATEQFNKNFGEIKTQISNLQELQSQVGELNNLLKPQQLRGELGEVIVRNLIADKLPRGSYEENHSFADGKQVEFVIKLNERLIPIDSKLSLEDFKRMRDCTEDRQRQTLRTDFKRTVKTKIDEVKQYIRPNEGTFEFALMVIPSEAVYYDLVANKDFLEEDSGLYDYARARNVFLTSPITFWAYLTALDHGLQRLEIGRRAEKILLDLQTLAKKIRIFSQDEFRVLGKHVRDAANTYEDADRKLRGIDEGLERLERSGVDSAPDQENRLETVV